jgi:hypothetical protein
MTVKMKRKIKAIIIKKINNNNKNKRFKNK